MGFSLDGALNAVTKIVDTGNKAITSITSTQRVNRGLSPIPTVTPVTVAKPSLSTGEIAGIAVLLVLLVVVGVVLVKGGRR